MNIEYFEYMDKLIELKSSVTMGKTYKSVFSKIGIPKEQMEDFFKWSEKAKMIGREKNNAERAKKLNMSLDDFMLFYKEFIILKMVHDKIIPHKLYKYMPINDYTLAMFENKKMWFSDLDKFNDEFEGRSPFPESFTEEDSMNYKKYLETKYNNSVQIDADKSIMSRFKDVLQKSASKSVDSAKASCFTTTPTNTKMWAHYGDNSKGVCVEFDVLEDPLFFYPILPIDYVKELPKTSYLKGSFDFPIKEIFFSKQRCWEEEDEIRVLKYKEGNLIEFNPRTITSVIFGTKSLEEDQAELSKIIKKNFETMQLKICSHNNSYDYDIDDLDFNNTY